MRHAIQIEQHLSDFCLFIHISQSSLTYYRYQNKNFIQMRIIKHIN